MRRIILLMSLILGACSTQPKEPTMQEKITECLKKSPDSWTITHYQERPDDVSPFSTYDVYENKALNIKFISQGDFKPITVISGDTIVLNSKESVNLATFLSIIKQAKQAKEFYEKIEPFCEF